MGVGGVDGGMSCWDAMKNNSSRTKACNVKCACGVCVAFIITADIICEAISDQPLPPPPHHHAASSFSSTTGTFIICHLRLTMLSSDPKFWG